MEQIKIIAIVVGAALLVINPGNVVPWALRFILLGALIIYTTLTLMSPEAREQEEQERIENERRWAEEQAGELHKPIEPTELDTEATTTSSEEKTAQEQRSSERE